MTENEKAMLDRWTAVFRSLPPADKERTLAFVEGVAFKADMMQSLSQPQTARPSP